jgi:hypothetical protein
MMAQIKRSYLSPAIKKNWYMMNQYYVVTTDYANLYFLNSNLLAFDELQQTWLQDTYRKLMISDCSTAREFPKWNIVFMHHPLRSPGKRYLEANYDDIGQYSLPETEPAIRGYQQQGVKCLNLALHNYFAGLFEHGIHFQLFFGAHDHLLAGMWQRESLPQSWQIISGAAGPAHDLQKVKIPQEYRDLGNATRAAAADAPKHGADFYYEHNGHVQLRVLNRNVLTVEFNDEDNACIYQKTFKKEAMEITCHDDHRTWASPTRKEKYEQACAAQRAALVLEQLQKAQRMPQPASAMPTAAMNDSIANTSTDSWVDLAT